MLWPTYISLYVLQLKPQPTNLDQVPDNVDEVHEENKKNILQKEVKEKDKLQKKKDKLQKDVIELSDLVIASKKVKEEKHTNKVKINIGEASKKVKEEKHSADVFDITHQVAQEENQLLDHSEENEEEKLRQAKLNVALDMLQKGLESLDNPQKKKSATPQPYPLIGNTGLSYMRKGLIASPAIYDPLKPVDPKKLDKLRDFLKKYEHIPLTEKIDEDIQFYRDLITPRKDWPFKGYGWLADYHLSAFLRLLRKRSMEVPSPFYSDRIAFIDQWFVSMWVRDFTQFNLNPKKWKFSQSYIDVALGKSPKDMPTNKRWIYEVDILYLVHQVHGDHWVTLEIDLPKEKIDCYDSILGDPSNFDVGSKTMHEKCRMFTRMIPALLNEVIPSSVRKTTNQQFKFRRRKGIPQNENPGDCGVYSLKYIEMQALGVVMDGLNDRNIQAIREKMAAEIYDEVPDMYAQFI